MIVIDESDAKHLIEPRGQATKANHDRSLFGDSKYTWWKNSPGKDIARFNPQASGRYRIWISWGAGYATHCEDARYVIRSASEEVEIATVNQRLAVGGAGQVDSVAKWSGLHDAGVHQLSPASEIVLIGGDTGTAITADAIVLQPESRGLTPETSAKKGELERSERVRPLLQRGRKIAQPPTKRAPVSAKQNEERFAPSQTSRVRFSISKTNNGSEACLDELEVLFGKLATSHSPAKARKPLRQATSFTNCTS